MADATRSSTPMSLLRDAPKTWLPPEPACFERVSLPPLLALVLAAWFAMPLAVDPASFRPFNHSQLHASISAEWVGRESSPHVRSSDCPTSRMSSRRPRLSCTAASVYLITPRPDQGAQASTYPSLASTPTGAASCSRPIASAAHRTTYPEPPRCLAGRCSSSASRGLVSVHREGLCATAVLRRSRRSPRPP